MKQKLISLAVGAAVLAPAVSMADVKVYGRADVSLDIITEETGSTTTKDNFELDSHGSRLGVKGKKELDNGWTAIYKMEFGVNVDDGGGPFSQRNIFVGVKTGMGEIIAGKHDTPGKKAQGKLDLFGDHDADFKNVTTHEQRASNIIQYTSPKIADAIKLKLAIIPGEESGADGTDNDSGLADGNP